MKKNFYQKPSSTVLELITENIIAASGDAGGTVNPMPPGCNKRSLSDEIWGTSPEDEHSIWK